MIRTIWTFLVATFAAYLLGAWLATQHVLGALVDMGVNVTFALWLDASAHDLLGMLPTYLPLLAVALALGFAVARLVARDRTGWQLIGYVSGGFLAVIVMHLLMRQAMDITAVAAVRTTSGLVFQGLAGAVGGYVFWRLGRGRPAARA